MTGKWAKNQGGGSENCRDFIFFHFVVELADLKCLHDLGTPDNCCDNLTQFKTRTFFVDGHNYALTMVSKLHFDSRGANIFHAVKIRCRLTECECRVPSSAAVRNFN